MVLLPEGKPCRIHTQSEMKPRQEDLMTSAVTELNKVRQELRGTAPQPQENHRDLTKISSQSTASSSEKSGSRSSDGQTTTGKHHHHSHRQRKTTVT